MVTGFLDDEREVAQGEQGQDQIPRMMMNRAGLRVARGSLDNLFMGRRPGDHALIVVAAELFDMRRVIFMGVSLIIMEQMAESGLRSAMVKSESFSWQ